MITRILPLFLIDLDLFVKQIDELLESNLSEDTKEGLHNLLGEIRDHVEDDTTTLHVFIENDSGIVTDVKITQDSEILAQLQQSWLERHGFATFDDYNDGSSSGCPCDMFIFEIKPDDLLRR